MAVVSDASRPNVPLPLVELHAALRQGSASARGLMEAVVAARAGGRDDPAPYIAWDGDNALALADHVDALLQSGRDTGPLMGLPVALKDLFGLPGFRTHAGTPTPLGPEWEQPGPVVRELLGQLALITGKTHTVEFAFGGLGTNAHWGTPRNPRDGVNARVPGGSSSGSGVAIAEGSARLAVATDTSGSVRVPASMTGVAGLKTTAGRWSTAGVVPLSPTLDTVGLMARDVGDLAFGFHALDGASAPTRVSGPAPSALRFGVPDQFFWEGCSPGVAEAVEAALRTLSTAGARIEPLELPGCDEAFRILRGGGLAAPEFAAFLQTCVPDRRQTLDPNVAARVRAGEGLSAVDYLALRTQLSDLAAGADDRLLGVDALLVPTVANTPPLLDQVEHHPDAYARENILALRNTVIGNLMGLCAVTLPVGADAAGMPVGLQLIGRAWSEPRLLETAMAVEAATYLKN